MTRFTTTLLIALSAVVFNGCTQQPVAEPEPELIQVVAANNVYADIAAEVGDDYVEVTTVVDDPTENPHWFVPDADDVELQSALAEADVVIVTGGGYDDALLDLLASSGNDDATVIETVDFLGIDPQTDGFNPHVWYHYGVIQGLAARLSNLYPDLDPEHDFAFSTHGEIVLHWISLVGTNAANLSDIVEGMTVVVTDRAPLYLLERLKMVNLTPLEFSLAVEADGEAAPELQQRVLDLVAGGSVDVVVYNAQTQGTATDALLAAAAAAGVPAVPITETIPADMLDGATDDSDVLYSLWQASFLAELRRAVVPSP